MKENKNRRNKYGRLTAQLPLHLMMLPGVVLTVIFNYIPLIGIVMAFEKFSPKKGIFGSDWVGLNNFKYLLNIPDIDKIVWNTFFISGMKLILGVIVPMTLAILITEIQDKRFKKYVQDIICFPHFLSWVILSSIFIDILSPSSGIVNEFLGVLGIKSIFFLGDETWFPYTMALTETWKEFGYGMIVYMAAIVGISPTLYEAAKVDGANRWQQIRDITVPTIFPIAGLMFILNMGTVLNTNFEQIYNLYSPQVYATGDIIDTLVYRIGMENAQFSVAAAAGLFKSLVSSALVGFSYYLAKKTSEHRIF